MGRKGALNAYGKSQISALQKGVCPNVRLLARILGDPKAHRSRKSPGRSQAVGYHEKRNILNSTPNLIKECR